MRIEIPDKELKESLEEALGTKVTKPLLKEFIEYLGIDLPQWINDNLHAFTTKLSEERRI